MPPPSERLDLQQFPGFVLHGVFAGRKDALVQRHQLSTTCKEHAANVMEQYATFFAQLSANPSAILVPHMLDMATQFRDASSELLGRHVFGIGDSVPSEDFLRSLLLPDSVVAASDPSCFEQCLLKYGPALIAHFRVYDDLKDKALKLHVGHPEGKCINKLGKERRLVDEFIGSIANHHDLKPSPSLCSHAMVLLAVRVDPATGQRFFLIQNFWLGKQFFVVDEVYFNACRGIAFFVNTRQPEQPSGLAARSCGGWVEADGGNSPDMEDD